MKKLILIITLIITVIVPATVFASDITDAIFRGQLTISNTGSSTATGVATVANINTQDYIDLGYMDADLGNVAIQNTAGLDTAFMPGYDGSPWCVYVNTINQNQYLPYNVYAKDATGGTIAYFPGSTGMSVDDADISELGDNFRIGFGGDHGVYLDTSVAGVIAEKTDAITFESDGAGNIVASITVPGNDDIPTGYAATGLYGQNANYATAYVTYTNLFPCIGQSFSGGIYTVYRTPIKFDTSSIPASATVTSAVLTITVTGDSSTTDFDIVIQNGQPDYPHDPIIGATDYIGGNYTGNGGSKNTSTIIVGDNDITLNSTGIGWLNKGGTTKLMLRSNREAATTTPVNGEYIHFNAISLYVEYEDYITVSAAVPSGHYDSLELIADGTDLNFDVDGVTVDTVALGGASVPDNAADWQFGSDATLYIGAVEVDVSGTPEARWVWEYGDTFTDSINSIVATPTFRTTSSDADVSAELVSFGPRTEATAPSYALGEEADQINITPSVTGDFSTTPGTSGFPLGSVITAVTEATSTPPQLPLTIIAAFTILAVSLTTSALMRRFGSGGIIPKTIAIIAVMGIFIGIGNFAFDFWMLIIFIILALAIMFGSKQIGWT